MSVQGKLGTLQVKDLKSDSEDASINRRLQNRSRASSLFSKAIGGSSANPGEFHIGGTEFALSATKLKITSEAIQLVVISDFVQRLVEFATHGPLTASAAAADAVEGDDGAAPAAAQDELSAAAGRDSSSSGGGGGLDFVFESKSIEVYLPDSTFDAASKARGLGGSGAELLVSIDTMHFAKSGGGALHGAFGESEHSLAAGVSPVKSKTCLGIDQLQIFATRPSRTHARLLKVAWHRGGRRPNFGSMKQAIALQVEERELPLHATRYVTTSQLTVQQLEAHVRLVAAGDAALDAASPMLRSDVAVASVAGVRTTLRERYAQSVGIDGDGAVVEKMGSAVSAHSGRIAVETLKQNQLQWQQWQHDDGGANVARPGQSRRFGAFTAQRSARTLKQQARSTVFQITPARAAGGGAMGSAARAAALRAPLVAERWEGARAGPGRAGDGLPVGKVQFATVGLFEAHLGVDDCELLLRVCGHNLLPVVEHLSTLSRGSRASAAATDGAVREAAATATATAPRSPSLNDATSPPPAPRFVEDHGEVYRELTRDADALELRTDCAVFTLRRDADADEVRLKVGVVCVVGTLRSRITVTFHANPCSQFDSLPLTSLSAS